MRLLAFLMTMSFAGLAYAGPKVEVTTSKGAFVIELAPDKAPKTVENFLAYVDAGFLFWDHLSPRDPNVYGPRWRYGCDPH